MRRATASETTSFVGRRQEIADVRRLLGSGRLVTLTGPGGVGKTRLARHVMREVERAFADGVAFVGLAELREDDVLPNLVADGLGLQDHTGRSAAETVLSHLRDRRMLLVVDNCEHVVDGAARFVADILTHCPDVVLLATSRQSLGCTGEQVLPVLPLQVPPDAAERPVADLSGYDGVRLFVERAVAMNPEFRLGENRAAVAEVCLRLDGLPLAIELAAARLRSLSVQQLAERLTRRLALLTTGPRTAPERQHTLRATIDWSYELCSDAERDVWARASVFAGSFDLDAAEFVCGRFDEGPDAVLNVIDGLLDKSVLLREESGDRVRYRMLEAVREYGQEQLEQTGELARVQRLHRDYFDRLTERADDEWSGPDQLVWVARLGADTGNLRAAIGWSLAEPGEAEVVLRMATRLMEYWASVRGYHAEARRWLDRALAVTPQEHPDRPMAVAMAGMYSLWQAELDEADVRLTEAERLAAEIDDEVLHARIWHIRSLESMLRTQPGTAELAASAAGVFRKHGLVRWEMHPLFIHGVSAAYEGDVDAGRRSLQRMIDVCKSREDRLYLGMAYFGKALVEVNFGDVDEADSAARESLRVDLAVGARLAVAYRLDCLAWVAARQQEYFRAATMFGAAARAWAVAGSVPDIAVPLPHRKFLKLTRSALDEAQFEAAYAEGREMDEATAVRYAFGDDGNDLQQAPAESPLTKRELEIADLVAAGLTNRDISSRLVISQRTVDTHVQHILTKLDFTKRAQIAVWVAERRSATPSS